MVGKRGRENLGEEATRQELTQGMGWRKEMTRENGMTQESRVPVCCPACFPSISTAERNEREVHVENLPLLFFPDLKATSCSER
jgi:hypothetical protein